MKQALHCLISIFVSLQLAQAQDKAPNSNKVPETNLSTAEEVQENFNLTKYNPLYFAYGEPTSKLQFSFKYQLVKVWPLYVGYTQLMFWDLKANSKPFRDLNYNPEVFYRINIEKDIFDSVDLGPIEHKSNGRDGVASRSFSRSFIQLNLKKELPKSFVIVSARFSDMRSLDDTNTDLSEYIGLLDLRITLTQFMPWVLDRGQFYLRVFPGGKWAQHWDRGGQEAAMSFRLGNLDLTPSIYLQYYNGYAESLLNYKRSVSEFRVGLLF